MDGIRAKEWIDLILASTVTICDSSWFEDGIT